MNTEAKQDSPRFRIVHRPWLPYTQYQVEELMHGSWMHQDGFKTQDEAERNIALRMKGPKVIKEYAPCETCGKLTGRLDDFDEYECENCRDNKAEAAYERQQSEGFRGGEASAFAAEFAARIQRELK